MLRALHSWNWMTKRLSIAVSTMAIASAPAADLQASGIAGLPLTSSMFVAHRSTQNAIQIIVLYTGSIPRVYIAASTAEQPTMSVVTLWSPQYKKREAPSTNRNATRNLQSQGCSVKSHPNTKATISVTAQKWVDHASFRTKSRSFAFAGNMMFSSFSFDMPKR